MIKYILAALVAVFLTGCETLDKKPEPIIEYKTKYIVIAPDAALLLPTKKALPPNRNDYAALNEFNFDDWRIKEKMLSEAYIKQSGAVDQCNIDKKAIRSFVEQAKAQYKNN